MKPVIALLGRPNVGKSTLFNKLTRKRDAIVADFPGLTRDRKYGHGNIDEMADIVIDTGGLIDIDNPLAAQMSEQTWYAVDEAHLVLLLVDAKAGMTPGDEMIAAALRRRGKQALLVMNKIDGIDADVAVNDFYGLGLGEPIPLAAVHNRGVKPLLALCQAQLQSQGFVAANEDTALAEAIRVAVVGRPNVGKSTLINRLCGEERVVASDLPGTTRDRIDVQLQRDDIDYVLIDTAGVRRRGKVQETVEKFSVVKTLQAVDDAQVVLLLIDAQESLTEQDMHLIGFVVEQGRALLLLINKWDHLDTDQRNKVKYDLDRRLAFLSYTRPRFVSALHGSGVGELFADIQKAQRSALVDLATPQLTRILEDATQQHPPPMVKGRRPKLRYAHQGGKNPPRIVIHGNQIDAIPESYRRYLSNTYRNVLKLRYTPVEIEFRSGENPFAGRRNTLTPRQITKKKRLMKFVKKGRH